MASSRMRIDMKKYFLFLVLAFMLTGCGTKATQAQLTNDETIQEMNNMIQLTAGENTILAELADNEAARQLASLLQKGSVTMSASNYGGFEKVCALGTRLPSDDVQTTTQPGDIMLYSSDQIVIFYGSNSWAYTRLAKVADADIPRLKAILSGSETQATIALA